MGALPIEDVIEIEQLLAAYAVAMTKNDVDTVVAKVFTDGDTGTGEQPLLFVDQTNHHMRMGWYRDSYVRTDKGWRLKTRSMTFLRRSGERDAGKEHDPLRPEPTA